MLGIGSGAWWSSSNSVTGTNVVQRGAGHKLMRRNRCGKRMGHRRVRKIDFTVNLIYPLFSRCPVSRGRIKPAHKEVLSSCLFGSTPSNHCCALTGDNRINISGCVQRIPDHPKSFVIVQWEPDTKEQKNNDLVRLLKPIKTTPVFVWWDAVQKGTMGTMTSALVWASKHKVLSLKE